MFQPLFNHRKAPVECKTLVQALPSAAADAELAAALNAGWQIINMSVTPVVVPGERNRYGVEMPAQLQVMRVVTMQRAICPPEMPAAAAAAAVNGHQAKAKEAAAPEPTRTDAGQPVGEARAEAEIIIIEPEAKPARKRPMIVEDDDEIVEVEEDPVPKKVEGRVMSAARARWEEARAKRKPIEEVTFKEAVQSGLYDAEELKLIGNREALAAARRAFEQYRPGNLRPLTFWLDQ